MYSRYLILLVVVSTGVSCIVSGCAHGPIGKHDNYGWSRTGLSEETIVAAGEPIAISSIEQLQKIGNDPAYPINGYYVLQNDIDASQTSQWNLGAGFIPIGKLLDQKDWNGFSGWFDGQGYAIKGLTIKRPQESGVGLFASLTPTAIIVNLGLESGFIHGDTYVGSLAGESTSNAVAACYSTCLVKGTSRVGGLIGINRGVIEACYSTAAVSGNALVGGLVGRNWKGVIAESYAAGRVSATDTSATGGLVGQDDSSVVRNSFWALDLTEQIESAGGTGLHSNRMMARTPFDEAGWDFVNLWTLIPGLNLPTFQYQQ